MNTILNNVSTLEEFVFTCNQMQYEKGDPLVIPLILLAKGMADIINHNGNLELLKKYAKWVEELKLFGASYEVD